MKTLILRKRKWARGGKNGRAKSDSGSQFTPGSALLNAAGRMCCLGFLGKQCGARDEQLIRNGMPAVVPGVAWPSGLVTNGFQGRRRNTSVCLKIAETNDNDEIKDSTRVRRLRPLFKRLGYRLVVKP